MRIVFLKIKNFRGIHSACISFPEEQHLTCIIGPGDCGKTTLLKAIEWALWPTWNLSATDEDFYGCVLDNPIEIAISLAELPELLTQEDKYGLFLRNADAVKADADNDEPVDGKSIVITVKLTIDKALEPKWEVVTNHAGSKTISATERRMLAFGVVGFDYEKDFSWGRSSVLQKYTDKSKNTLHEAYMQAMREAIAGANLTQLDSVAEDLVSVGKEYGVAFEGEVHNRIMMQNGSFSTTVGIFDKNIPFILRGLGSKRLLSMGMNISAFQEGTLLLIDEVETGLEPYRISGLINRFRQRHSADGQIIMTTHSVSTICECSEKEIAVLNNKSGEVTLHFLHSGDKETDDSIQSILRTEPAAFLSKRIIVCEGKTEIGLLRAVDMCNGLITGERFAYHGVSSALGGGGTKFFDLAVLLKDCGYDVCILMDSDVQEEEEKKLEFIAHGIPVFSWNEGNAIEEQLYSDCSIDGANKLLQLAIEFKSYDHVKAKIKAEYPEENRPFVFDDENEHITIQEGISPENKRRIGTVAKNKKCEWYKRIDLGEKLGYIAIGDRSKMGDESSFWKTMSELEKWIKDETRRA